MTILEVAGMSAGVALLAALLFVQALVLLGCAILVVRVISERGRR